MKQIIKTGTTSKRMVIFIQKTNVQTGAGLTGLTSASAGLTWYYYREADTSTTAVSIVGETIGTWTSGGFVELDATHMPGVYEIGVPNAVLGASAWSVMILQGAASMVPVAVEFEITGFDLGTATQPTNVIQWLGTAVTAATGGVPDVNVKNYNNVTATTDANSLPKVDVEAWKAGLLPVQNITGVPKVDVVDWLGTLVTAATAGIPDVNTKNYANVTAVVDANNLPKVDTEDWKGTAVLAPSVGGQPKVETVTNDDKTGYSLTQAFPTNFSSLVIDTNGRIDLSKVLGATINALIAGRVDANVGVNNDKTGYSLTQAFPTNFGALSITAGGGITVATNNDKTGYTLVAGQITVKKNQALSGFTFPMFSTTTGQLLTGATVISSRSIDGGAVGITTNSATSIGSGLYKLDLSAADLNGNTITMILTAAGAADSTITFVTQP